VRYLELLASVVFWWHPVVWWARRQLRRVEEQCCDAWVVRTLSGHPRVYARALLKTLEFLSGSRVETPALACGAMETGPLKERLTMIMKRRMPKMPSRIQFAALALVALPALLVFPTWADRDETPEEPRESAVRAADAVEAAEADLRKELLALERKAVELELQLQTVRTEQMALEQEFRDRVGGDELDRTRAEAERAREAYEHAERLERRMTLERRERDLERDRIRGMRELEAPLRQLQLEIEEAETDGDLRRAEELREEIARQELEGQTEKARQLDEALRRQIEIEMLERRIRELEDESDGARAR